jgi:hypothetical protein
MSGFTVQERRFAADPCAGDGGLLPDTFLDPIADVGVDVAPCSPWPGG